MSGVAEIRNHQIFRRIDGTAPCRRVSPRVRSVQVVPLLSWGVFLMLTVKRMFADEHVLVNQDGTYVVHFFRPEEAEEFLHHGKVILQDRFRFHLESELPDPQYLAWHYQQCAQMHMRGFFV